MIAGHHRQGRDSMSRLQGLQTLRALAALMVLVGHVLAEAEHYLATDLPGDAIPWTRGVDIFFVISGFIIALSATRYRHRPLAFLGRRALRVVPLYYLFTTLMVVTLLLVPGGAKDTALDPGQIVTSYLFLPFERHDGRIAPVLSLGWTLNYEIFFYVLMALCLWLRRPFLGLAALLTGLASLSLVPGKPVALTFWSNPLILEFLFGIALAMLWQRGLRRHSAPLALLVLAAGMILLVLLDQTGLPRFLAAGIPAVLIVAAGTLFAPAIDLPMQSLGDASFALYLSHRFTLRVLTLGLLPHIQADMAWAYVGLACAACLGVAVLVHHRIERPLLAMPLPRAGALS